MAGRRRGTSEGACSSTWSSTWSSAWGPAVALLGFVLGAFAVLLAEDEPPCKVAAASRCDVGMDGAGAGADVVAEEPAPDDHAFDDSWGSLGP